MSEIVANEALVRLRARLTDLAHWNESENPSRAALGSVASVSLNDVNILGDRIAGLERELYAPDGRVAQVARLTTSEAHYRALLEQERRERTAQVTDLLKLVEHLSLDTRGGPFEDGENNIVDRARALVMCPHGMPRYENICGPCSEGRPNRLPHEPKEQRQVMTLHGFEILSLAEFLGGDPDTEVSVARYEAGTSDDGEEMPAGNYAWITDYPEEGCVLLSTEPPSET